MPINSPSTVAALSALQAAWRKKYAGTGGSDVVPAAGSTPTPRPSVSRQAVTNSDSHQPEFKTEAARIQEENRRRREAAAAARPRLRP